jgi:L-iditol 2-dehydrogenase
MLRIKLARERKLVLEDVSPPRVRAKDVLIRVYYCGICGSDIHAYLGRHPFISPPVVQGHEFSGIVEKVGRGVRGIKKGERVTIEPSIVCGRCRWCRSGRYNICENLKVIGCQMDGAFSEYISIPSEKVWKLPEKIGMKEGALVEPLAVGIHALRKAKVAGNGRTLIIGAGPVGLSILIAAKEKNMEVLVSDLNRYRLKVAEKLGGIPVGKKVKADFVFECVGSEAAAVKAVESATKGSRIIIVGVHPGMIKFPLHLVQDRELEIIGSLMYLKQDYRDAINLLESREVGELITHILPLRELERAYSLILKRKSNTLKVLIKVYEDSCHDTGA